MNNLLVTTYYSQAAGLRAKVWLTPNGQWTVSYHDIDSGEQLQVWHKCATRKQAERKAREFVNGKAGPVSVSA